MPCRAIVPDGERAFLLHETMREFRALDVLVKAWTAGYGSKPDPSKIFPQTEHPVVARHPRTGRKFLYVNGAFTSHIVQLTRKESDAILNLLYRHIERHLAFQTRIQWSENALLIWDNWASQHHAIWNYYPYDRWGDRVSVVSGGAPSA